MNELFAIKKQALTEHKVQPKSLSKKKIPKSKVSDVQIDYVTALKNDSPFDYVTIQGVVFTKRVFPPDKFLRNNIDKHYDARLQTHPLSEEQAKFIQDRAKKIVRNVTTIKYDEEGRVEEEINTEVKYSDIIILEPLDSFIQNDIKTITKRKLI